MDTADKAAIGEYLYHTAVMDGSGEYALQKVLGSFVFARHPLAHRLHELKCVRCCNRYLEVYRHHSVCACASAHVRSLVSAGFRFSSSMARRCACCVSA